MAGHRIAHSMAHPFRAFTERGWILRAPLRCAPGLRRKEEFLFALYGTTPQPSPRCARVGLTLKSCPDTCLVDRVLVSSIITDKLIEYAHEITIIAFEMQLANWNILSRDPAYSRFSTDRI